jgi:hypothetical protein
MPRRRAIHGLIESPLMPPRPGHIPHSIERTALQKLITGQPLSLVKLHPAGKDTVARMLSKGWIVSETHAHGLRYRITAAGEAALKAKIPTNTRKTED